MTAEREKVSNLPENSSLFGMKSETSRQKKAGRGGTLPAAIMSALPGR